jgi:acetoin utilization deacetylase AcuC-like enzyme
MKEIALEGVLRTRLMALIAEFALPVQAKALLHRASEAVGRIDFEAHLHGNEIASISLDADGIRFLCHHGIYGRLYPNFGLDEESLTRTATGQPIDLAATLRTLRLCFRQADELKLTDDREEFDEEVFIVDPSTAEHLIEEQQT